MCPQKSVMCELGGSVGERQECLISGVLSCCKEGELNVSLPMSGMIVN